MLSLVCPAPSAQPQNLPYQPTEITTLLVSFWLKKWMSAFLTFRIFAFKMRLASLISLAGGSGTRGPSSMLKSIIRLKVSFWSGLVVIVGGCCCGSSFYRLLSVRVTVHGAGAAQVSQTLSFCSTLALQLCALAFGSERLSRGCPDVAARMIVLAGSSREALYVSLQVEIVCLRELRIK